MIRSTVAAGAVLVALGVLGAGGLAAGGPAGGGRAGGGPAGGGIVADGLAGDGPARAVLGAPAEASGGARGTVAAGAGAAAPGVPAYTAPVDGPVVVVRPFDGPPQPWAAGHRGVDLAAHPGQPVRAPAGGVVTFAGTVVDRGVVTVAHDDGLRSSLEPLLPSVRRGQRVLPGQVVGTVADVPGHCRPGTCLHWGLRRGETYLDPMAWVLGRGPVVLLPQG